MSFSKKFTGGCMHFLYAFSIFMFELGDVMEDLVDNYMKSLNAIYDHVGGNDLGVGELDISTDYHWVYDGECISYGLDEVGVYGFDNVIDRCIGSFYTMFVVRDGSRMLHVLFRNDREVLSE
jgi:hypothetical protein